MSPLHIPHARRLGEVGAAQAGQTVLVRARLQVARETGKLLFVTLRQAIATLQGIATKAANPDLFKWLGSLPRETVLDVTGTLSAVEKRVESVTQGDVELQITSAFIVSRATPEMPFQLEDAARPERVIDARDAEIRAAEAAGTPAPAPYPLVSQVRRAAL